MISSLFILYVLRNHKNVMERCGKDKKLIIYAKNTERLIVGFSIASIIVYIIELIYNIPHSTISAMGLYLTMTLLSLSVSSFPKIGIPSKDERNTFTK